jgi:hypothetical protein
MDVGGQRHAPAALSPAKRPGTYCTRGWVGPRAGLDGCEISCPPTGFDPRTVQPVASRYRRKIVKKVSCVFIRVTKLTELKYFKSCQKADVGRFLYRKLQNYAVCVCVCVCVRVRARVGVCVFPIFHVLKYWTYFHKTLYEYCGTGGQPKVPFFSSLSSLVKHGSVRGTEGNMPQKRVPPLKSRITRFVDTYASFTFKGWCLYRRNLAGFVSVLLCPWSLLSADTVTEAANIQPTCRRSFMHLIHTISL